MSEAITAEENKLLTEPIQRLIRKISVPASVGFFFHTMYNVIDTFYGGKLSTEALAALSLSFPVYFIIIALGSGIGSGTTALIAHEIGSNKKNKAKKYAAQALSFTFFTGIFLTLLGLVVAPFLFRILGAEGVYLDLALSYMNIIFYGAIFFVAGSTLNAILNAVGDTKSYRNFLILGFFLNLILDPILMFGWLGVPAFGLAGVAWATVIIQIAGMLYLWPKVLATKLVDEKTRRFLWPEREVYKDIAAQGFPASLSMMMVAIGIFVVTFFVSMFGKAAVAAYGIATRVEQIALLPTLGLNIAVRTLIAQNNGAGKLDRVKEAFFQSMKDAILVLFLSEQFMNIFTNDLEVISIGSTYLKIAALMLIAYPLIFIAGSALQGLKKPMFPLYLGLFRQIIAPLILFSVAIYILNMSILGIWWGIFVIVWVSAVVAWWYARRVVNGLASN